MASILEEEEILETAVTGIRRVAEAVASIPEKARAKALVAVESTYRQTMLDLGYEEGPAESWVSTIMVRLQAEVLEQAAVRQTPTQTLQEELVLAESELEGNVVEIRETEEQ